MKAETFLKSNPVRYAGILEVIRRGTACIHEDEQDGIYLTDTISQIGFIACSDAEQAYRWFCKHDRMGYSLLNIFDEKLKDRIVSEGKMEMMVECHQYAYLSQSQTEMKTELNFVHAECSDLPFIMSVYDTLEEWEIRMIIERQTLWIARMDEIPVGIIGCHLEGSMGLLVVLPEYRRKGYALQMESFLISTLQERGCYCFGQVVKGNHASEALQVKAGMQMDDQLQYWLYNE